MNAIYGYYAMHIYIIHVVTAVLYHIVFQTLNIVAAINPFLMISNAYKL